MHRFIFFHIFILSSSLLFSQEGLNSKFYLDGTITFTGIDLDNNPKKIGNLYYNNVYGEGSGISGFLKLKDNFGVHFGLYSMAYQYRLSRESIESQHPGFYIPEINLVDLENFVGWIYLGGGYKLSIGKRIVIIPFIDLGCLAEKSSTINPVVLKAIGTNNIRTIEATPNIDASFISYRFGTNFYFHLGKHWGISLNIITDRYSPNINYSIAIRDYYYMWENLNVYTKFNNFQISASVGTFISF